MERATLSTCDAHPLHHKVTICPQPSMDTVLPTNAIRSTAMTREVCERERATSCQRGASASGMQQPQGGTNPHSAVKRWRAPVMLARGKLGLQRADCGHVGRWWVASHPDIAFAHGLLPVDQRVVNIKQVNIKQKNGLGVSPV